jgi:23S rRNA pseudouridine1911/1915/1917 synthase
MIDPMIAIWMRGPQPDIARRVSRGHRVSTCAYTAAVPPAREPRSAAFEVEPAEAGARLDQLLARRLALSRSEVRGLLARGAVRVDGRRQGAGDKGARVAAGARVEVERVARRAELVIRPAPEPRFAVLASGPGWLALDKPPRVAVHPRDEEETGTLANFAVALHPELQGVGEGGLRSGVVHRIDLDTSGVVLMATRESAWQRLRVAFRRHRVEKRYRALALGELADVGRADVALVVAQHRPARVRVVEAGRAQEAGARRCRLAWRVCEHFAGGCLVELELETGFLHQIRATLAHLGAPVAGDRVYGLPADADPSSASRQMLHAARVRFEEIAAESPDPPDFLAALARLRARGA